MPESPSRCSLSSARRATSNLQPSRVGPRTKTEVEMFLFLFFSFILFFPLDFLWSFLQSLLLGAGRWVGCIEERQIWDLDRLSWTFFLWWPAMPFCFCFLYGVWDGWNCNWDISWSTLECNDLGFFALIWEFCRVCIPLDYLAPLDTNIQTAIFGESWMDQDRAIVTRSCVTSLLRFSPY